mmetsp:Transcript_29057/g.69614  ORF Transcript_29057/g.69614 Transcript_29057/m.69614 type:complete len:216 (-) Transcript_29057:167-814(-)
MLLRSSAVSVKVEERKTRMVFGTSLASSAASSLSPQCPLTIASTKSGFRSCMVAGAWMQISGCELPCAIRAASCAVESTSRLATACARRGTSSSTSDASAPRCEVEECCAVPPAAPMMLLKVSPTVSPNSFKGCVIILLSSPPPPGDRTMSSIGCAKSQTAGRLSQSFKERPLCTSQNELLGRCGREAASLVIASSTVHAFTLICVCPSAVGTLT